MTPEEITIVVTPRDRFTTTAKCMHNISKNMRKSFQVTAVIGGMPERLRRNGLFQFLQRVVFDA